ncbi:MAG TPA: hypothetical protein VFR26_02575 [Acidimicrobiales bacterium]|nr:hypothetical protein [Acidimicrobiales bacterium]
MSHLPHPARRRLRRITSALAVAVAVVVATLTGLIPSPSGGDEAGAEPVPAGTLGVTRYFGRGAYDGIRAAVAATPRSCALSDDELTALVMAPIFKEVSMAETPETAPSPMTLSRWDEWSGRWSGSNNLNANYGLYAFRDPNTPYKRAFWTPGIGIFQYDVAGVGKPFTAAEMMNVQFIAGDVAGGMANRYCAAGGDSYTNRAAAWQPWSGLGGVAKSEALFQEMVGLDRVPFSTIGLVDGIENTGGMRTHTCLLGGVPTPCDFVDPAAAQGANWWANANIDGGQIAAGEAPLTAPFYVVKRNGYEERHWLASDTGYDTNISARRPIGLNARPMDAEPGSGLEWFAGSDLCDADRPELGCPIAAPAAQAPEPGAEAADAAPTELDASWLWAALAELTVAVGDASSEPAATDSADEAAAGTEAPANSTFSFTRGLAIVPPAVR